MLGVYKVDNMSYSIHMGIGKLLSQLKKKFEESSRPYPFLNEYLQNNRAERRKEMAEKEAQNRNDFELDDDTIRDLNISLRADEPNNGPMTPVRTPGGTPRTPATVVRSLAARLSMAVSPASSVSTTAGPSSQADVIPDSQDIIPDSQDVVPVSQDVVPDSQDVVPDSQADPVDSSGIGSATLITSNGNSNGISDSSPGSSSRIRNKSSSGVADSTSELPEPKLPANGEVLESPRTVTPELFPDEDKEDSDSDSSASSEDKSMEF